MKRAYDKSFYLFWTWFSWMLFFLFTRCTVEGKENVPPHGPLIVVANHLCFLDPPLVAASMPRRVRFVAKKELYDMPVVGFLTRSYGSIRVDRDGPQKEMIVAVDQALRRDAAIGMFPEGKRSRGALGRGKPGATMLALRTGAPMLPIAITGTEQITSLWALLFKRRRVTVTIGQVFTPPGLEGNVGKAQIAGLTDMMMERIATMLPPERRGYYARKPSGAGLTGAEGDVERSVARQDGTGGTA